MKELRSDDVPATTPSVFRGGYLHRARIRCRACGYLPDGSLPEDRCGFCDNGWQEVGCGGLAERDERWGMSYCCHCCRTVPSEEVTRQ